MVSKSEKKRRKRTVKDRVTIPAPGSRVVPSSSDALKLQALARRTHETKKTRNVENWGLNPEQVGGPVSPIVDVDGALVPVCAAPLPAFADMKVRRDVEGKPRGAWLTNPFKLLGDSGTLTAKEQNAGQNLLDIYAVSKGLDGAPEVKSKLDHVDGGDPDAWGREDRKQYHIKLFGRIIHAMSPPAAKLMESFCFALIEEDRPLQWHGLVMSVTGRPDLDRRRASERVKMACEELVIVVPRETLHLEMDTIIRNIDGLE